MSNPTFWKTHLESIYWLAVAEYLLFASESDNKQLARRLYRFLHARTHLEKQWNIYLLSESFKPLHIHIVMFRYEMDQALLTLTLNTNLITALNSGGFDVNKLLNFKNLDPKERVFTFFDYNKKDESITRFFENFKELKPIWNEYLKIHFRYQTGAERQLHRLTAGDDGKQQQQSPKQGDDENDLGPLILPRPMPQLKRDVKDASWNTLQGLDHVKTEIMNNLIKPMYARRVLNMKESVFQQIKGTILQGPAGVGKTSLPRAAAYHMTTEPNGFLQGKPERRMRTHIFELNSSNLKSKWVGQGARLVRRAFSVIRDWSNGIYTGWRSQGVDRYAYLMDTEHYPYHFKPPQSRDVASWYQKMKKSVGVSAATLSKTYSRAAEIYAAVSKQKQKERDSTTDPKNLTTPKIAALTPNIDEKTGKASDVCFVFIDEAEALLSSRSQSETSISSDITTTLMQEISETAKNKNIIFFASTNLVSRIDSAIIDRFELTTFIDLPIDVARYNFIKSLICRAHLDERCRTSHPLTDIKNGLVHDMATYLTNLTGWNFAQAQDLLQKRFGKKNAAKILALQGFGELGDKKISARPLRRNLGPHDPALSTFGFGFRGMTGVVFRFLNALAESQGIPLDKSWGDEKVFYKGTSISYETYIEHEKTSWKKLAKSITMKNIINAANAQEYVEILAESYPQFSKK